MFGRSLALSGDVLAVGAPYAERDNRGAVYTYERFGTTWVQTAKLSSSQPASREYFGQAVAIDVKTLVVGASGAVYVFERSGYGWSSKQTLAPAGLSSSTGFGYSVDLDGDRLVVGYVDGSSSAAYVYHLSGGTWTLEAKLVPLTPPQRFGKAVAISGSTVAAVDDLDDTKATNAGAVFVFVRQTSGLWVQQSRLTASDGSAYDYLGHSGLGGVPGPTGVSLLGDRLVTGSDIRKEAYIYERSRTTWTEVAKLRPSPVHGPPVSLTTDLVALAGDDVFSKGTVALYRGNSTGTWGLEQILAPSGYVLPTIATAADGDTVAFGTGDPNNTTDTGSVYIYRRSGGTWSREAKLPVSTPTCQSPKVLCGGTCVDLSTDKNNCGSCGTTC